MTGSIAAVETIRLARELRRHGASVHAVMSEAAQSIITPLSLEFATGNHVVTEITGAVEHVTLAGAGAGHADCILICPCTLNTIGKLATGVADTPPTLVAATGMSHIPLILVPTMHETMSRSPRLEASLDTLASCGVVILHGATEESKHKMPTFREIIEEVASCMAHKDLAGASALVTLGATREPIDDIRHITNRSTGKMGAAVAWELQRRGADVTVVAGCGVTEELPGDVIYAETAQDVRKALLERCNSDIYVMAMAVSDFSVDRSRGKLSSSQRHEITLSPHGKILPELKSCTSGTIVGFKAAHGVDDTTLVQTAESMRKAYDIDLVVANDVGRQGRGFGTDTNEVFIVGPKGMCRHVQLAPKHDVATALVDTIRDIRKDYGL